MKGFSYLQRKVLGGEDNISETSDTLFSKLFHYHVLQNNHFELFVREWHAKKNSVNHNVKNIKFYDDLLGDLNKSYKLSCIYSFLSKKLSKTSCRECKYFSKDKFARVDAISAKDEFCIVYEIKLSKYKMSDDYKQKFLSQCCFTKKVLFDNNIYVRLFILFYVNLSNVQLEKYVFYLKNDCDYDELIKNVKSRYILRDDNNFIVK